MGVEDLRRPGKLFPHTSEMTLDRLFSLYEHCEIHSGCGARPCRMCLVNGKPQGNSMEPETVFELLSLADKHAPSDHKKPAPINLFYIGDPIYYYAGGKTVADIIAWGIEHTNLRFYFRTHGFLYEQDDQEIPLEAISQMSSYLKDPHFAHKANKRVSINMSIDPWGQLGTHTETDQAAFAAHLWRIRRNLSDLLPIRSVLSRLYFFYNPNDKTGIG